MISIEIDNNSTANEEQIQQTEFAEKTNLNLHAGMFLFPGDIWEFFQYDVHDSHACNSPPRVTKK